MERSNSDGNNNCFEEGGIIKNDDLIETEEEDLEFKALVQELCSDLSVT